MAINLSTLVNTTDSRQLAKAWVNFNGSSGAIVSSYNVTSVTRNSAGNYTISFTNPLSANYSVQATIGMPTAITYYTPLAITGSQLTTSSVIAIYVIDPSNVYVAYFGN
jgi:hypothetical protein